VSPGRELKRTVSVQVADILLRFTHKISQNSFKSTPRKLSTTEKTGMKPVFSVVPGRGLEPPQVSLHGPKPSASTNFATPAGVVVSSRNKFVICPHKLLIIFKQNNKYLRARLAGFVYTKHRCGSDKGTYTKLFVYLKTQCVFTLVRPPGLEPGTLRLRAVCSTN